MKLPLEPGTPIDVMCSLTGTWSTHQFELYDVGPDGALVRRRSDGTVLPIPFSLEKVRPSNQALDGW